MEVSKCWKIVEFPKISIKIKNCKTFYEAKTASRLKEIIHFYSATPHQRKAYYGPENTYSTARYFELNYGVYKTNANPILLPGILSWSTAFTRPMQIYKGIGVLLLRSKYPKI